MKTGTFDRPRTAPIVQLLGEPVEARDGTGEEGAAAGPTALERARAFAAPLLENRALATGEEALAHADGVAAILRGIGAAAALQAAGYLVHAADFLARPEEVIGTAFGAAQAGRAGRLLAVHAARAVRRRDRGARSAATR